MNDGCYIDPPLQLMSVDKLVEGGVTTTDKGPVLRLATRNLSQSGPTIHKKMTK